MTWDWEPVQPFLRDTHRALATRTERFVGDLAPPLAAPTSDADGRTHARAVLQRMAAAGCLQPITDLDWRGCCVVREAIAGHSPFADALFAIQALGATPMQLTANATARAKWLPGLLEGRFIAAFAMTEPDAGSDVAAIATTARRDGDAFVLEGTKTLISNAGIADVHVVFATTDPSLGRKGITCFVVPRDTPGLAFAEPQIMSAPHPLGTLTFTGCRVPEDQMLGEIGDGWRIGLATLERVRATVGAAACGMAARAIEIAVQHATERQQFGQALAHFQLIKHKLAAMALELRASRLLVYSASHRLDEGHDATTASAMAKLYATEAAQRIVDQAVQIVGGRGVLASHPVDHLYRSVRALRIYEGTSEIQHLIIAGQLLKGGA